MAQPVLVLILGLLSAGNSLLMELFGPTQTSTTVQTNAPWNRLDYSYYRKWLLKGENIYIYIIYKMQASNNIMQNTEHAEIFKFQLREHDAASFTLGLMTVSDPWLPDSWQSSGPLLPERYERINTLILVKQWQTGCKTSATNRSYQW